MAHTASNPNSLASQNRLEAIAKCDSTLEVQPGKNISAIPYIKAALPTYTTTGHYESKDPISKTQLFANIPLSDAACDQAWKGLACFEVKDTLSLQALIPSIGVKLMAWKAVLTSATASGIDITQELDAHVVKTFVDEHEEWLPGLIPAVIQSMATQSCENGRTLFHIEEIKCAHSVGDMLLREQTENGRVSVSLKGFMDSWADLLPEKWRGRAEVSLLKGLYRLENDGKDITLVEPGSVDGGSAGAAAPADAKSTLGAKRKWHEKFRASKKTV